MVERHHLGGFFQALVAGEGVAGARVLQRAVHLELARRAGLGFLLVHGGGKAGLVHAHLALAAHVFGQIQRKAVGVVQLEGHLARQLFGPAGQRGVQKVHAVGQRFKKTLFFVLQYVGDALALRLQARISIAHEQHQVGHQLVEKRLFLAQLVAVADGAAHDAALHIAPALVAGQHAVADQKRGGANVVGNHPEALVVQVFLAGLAGGGIDQCIKDVDLVVAVHMLQDGGQAL